MTVKQMGEELREYPRLEQEFLINFEIVAKTVTTPIVKPEQKGKARNISGGGLYLIVSGMGKGIVKKLLEREVKLSIEFYLPDFQNKIRALGEARWARAKQGWLSYFSGAWELGIRFVQIQTEDKDSIIKYIINRQIEEHLIKPR